MENGLERVREKESEREHKIQDKHTRKEKGITERIESGRDRVGETDKETKKERERERQMD